MVVSGLLCAEGTHDLDADAPLFLPILRSADCLDIHPRARLQATTFPLDSALLAFSRLSTLGTFPAI